MNNNNDVNTSYISILPPVLITSILCFTDEQSLLKARATCKLWREASVDARITQWKIFYQKIWEQEPPSNISAFESLQDRLQLTGLNAVGTKLLKLKLMDRPFSIAIVRAGKYPIKSANFLKDLTPAIYEYRGLLKSLKKAILFLKLAKENSKREKEFNLVAQYCLAEAVLIKRESDPSDQLVLHKLIISLAILLIKFRKNDPVLKKEYILIDDRVDSALKDQLDNETLNLLSTNESHLFCILKYLFDTELQSYTSQLGEIFTRLSHTDFLITFIKRYLTLLYRERDQERIKIFIHFLIEKQIPINDIFINIQDECDIPYDLILEIMEIAFESKDEHILRYCTEYPPEEPMQWLIILSKKPYDEPADEEKMISIAKETIKQGCSCLYEYMDSTSIYYALKNLNPKLLKFFLTQVRPSDISGSVNSGLKSLLDHFEPNIIVESNDEQEEIESDEQEKKVLEQRQSLWDEQSMSLCKEVLSIILGCPFIQIEQEICERLKQHAWLEETFSNQKTGVKRKKIS